MVSILQLFILIICGVAFSVLILEAWCQKAGSRGVAAGNEVRVEAVRRPRSFSAGFSCRAFPEALSKGWQASTTFQALSRNSRHCGPRCIW